VWRGEITESGKYFMASPETTTVIAVWGAITGTIGTFAGLIGLWLRFKQQAQDKRKLTCKSSFGFDSPSHPTHRITVRSLGKRPVTLDHIRYYLTPRTRWHRLTKWAQHKRGRWLWKQEPRHAIKLADGEKTELRIALPDGISISEVYKVAVVDQTGKAWQTWWPSHRELLRIATSEELEVERQTVGLCIVQAVGYRLGDRYFIQTEFKGQGAGSGQITGRGFWFMDKDKYKLKLADITKRQMPAFLSREINEIT
ncbi:hypothetical protein, partial [Rhodanobacter sp. 115]|uniref:hypothetical protein n=2 Tax=Rhodanobacter sp. FW021-MT20 TaxID=1162282 RepID=UPI001ED90881